MHVVLDAKEMIHTLKGDDDWFIRAIISDFKGLAPIFSLVKFSFIPKTFNGQAHKLVKLRHCINQDIVWEKEALS